MTWVPLFSARVGDDQLSIATSSFSREAADYAASVNASVVLIEGERLAELMIAYAIGVQTVETYRVVELDEDYFE